MNRFSSQAGIAIGPILFVIALLGILATVIASGFGDFGQASVSDRVYNDIVSQANLIRTKINECNIKYGTNNNGDGYPASDQTSGTLVSALDCAGDQAGQTNLWTGARNTVLPPATIGFDQWYYMNAGVTGGRCIWTQPSGTANAGIKAGLTHAATKFSSQEVTYNSAGTTNRFVIWITLPSGSADSHCASS